MVDIPEIPTQLRAFAGAKRNHPLSHDSTELDRERLHTNPMSAEWKESCENNFWWGSRQNMEALYFSPRDGRPLASDIPQFIELRSILLSIGGESVCFPAMEEDMKDILELGQLWYGDKAIMKKGKPSRCHQNACDLWASNRDRVRICTGYALSEDGMWRQHSWLVWCKPRVNTVVETTRKRVAYYGFVMNTEQCERFDYLNI